MTSIQELLKLEQIDRDIFRGIHAESILPKTFGGQVAGQALRSANATVDEGSLVHSLHGYFLRPGNTKADTVFLVDRIRDGRSFTTRRVTGMQAGEAIFTMSASFQREEVGVEHSDEMPPAIPPEDVPDARETADSRPVLREWMDFDIRIVPQEKTEQRPGQAVHQQVWFRHRDPLPHEHSFHVAALAYMSDMTLLMSARVPHEGSPYQAASLDHAMWFLRRFRADEWLLYDQRSPSAGGGRALTAGRIFTRDGTLAAVVIQEGLLRFHV
ncbi:acyl-CoA thioesterase II [Tsukamurella sp. 8F]|uniref:acyl-CoA thioesterase n=1 Tax=unclassified Tsukamurella TaxID=2633480 RepID=UPI0023B97328|nr:MULTISPECIES: acyl-CoA thioesterase II [unclassified Tsukamurella]MDF0531376.1 acyl-CoA thioesterase II [Tsukamurella sp. 8J]MDF0585318.1 acyl-CoA thioesterase II [Tsukamurella sp. 8F]